MPGSPQWSLSLRFPHQNPVQASPLPHLSYMPRPSHSVCEYFVTKIRFHGELLAHRPTPKLEDHPLSAVCDCLFNIFAATLHTGSRSSIHNLRTRHTVVTGTHDSTNSTFTNSSRFHAFNGLQVLPFSV
jgi:hypothetical protein